MSNQKRSPSVAELRTDPKNANKGSARGRALVEASLQECGAGRSILADRDGTIIAGNKTLEAAAKLGLPVKIVESAGDELVVVQRSDLSLDEGDKARRLAYLDNRASELGLAWDTEQLLADMQGGVDLSGIFERPELDELLAGLLERQGLTDPDAIPALPEEPATRPDDIWLCGRHRVGCLDAIEPTHVDRLLAGARPRLAVTDPPFGVSLDLGWRDGVFNKLGRAAPPYMTEGHGNRTLSGDTRIDWSAAFELVDSLEVIYCWHAGIHAVTVGLGLERIGFEIRAQIVWDKGLPVISRGPYDWAHEPAYYAVKRSAKAGWIGKHGQSTIWSAPSPKAIMAGSSEEKCDHPAQKPVTLYTTPIANHEVPEVYDCFLGSGTCLIACEMTDRRCFGMEIDPKYVDLIVTRWQRFAGEEATLEATGQSFAAVAAERLPAGG